MKAQKQVPESKAKWVPITVKLPRDILCITQSFAEIEGVTFDQYVARGLASVVAGDTDMVAKHMMARQDSVLSD